MILPYAKGQDLGRRVACRGRGLLHGAVIGRYERDEVKPSIEMATQQAEVLEVSLDYLVGATDTLLDTSIVTRILDIQQLDPDTQTVLFNIIDTYLRDAKARMAYQ